MAFIFASFDDPRGLQMIAEILTGAEKSARLVALKDRYDPDSLFRMNQNIKPSGAAGEPAFTALR